MSRTFIVTGGFGALGRAVVNHLTTARHKVAIVDLAAAPDQVAATLALGGVDLADEVSVALAYRTIAERVGLIDGVINIAGGFVWEPVETGSLDNFDRMYRTNLRTVAASARAAIPLLRAGGAIVNVGAAAAAHPGSGMAAYAASKAGVMAVTESLANELKPRGIRVNAVLPTIIDTPTNRSDMPDADTSAWVKPEAAAKVIAFLVSPESGAITGAGLPLTLAG